MKHFKKFSLLFAAAFALLAVCSVQPGAASEVKQKNLILATTTSTQDSGLLDVLIPIFSRESGYCSPLFFPDAGKKPETLGL